MAGEKYFNGSAVVFASATIGSLRSIKWDTKGKDIEVTSNDDTEHVSVAGKPKQTIALTIVGAPPSIGVGSTGSLTVTWKGAQTQGTLTSAAVLSISQSGQMDGEVTSDVTFVKSAT
jgi:hypothetical protein